MDISGNTLLVYVYVLKKRGNCGVREIQRALGFSSSSSAHYHLEKLAHTGVLIKDPYGYYSINDEARVRFIDRFFFISGRIVPKQVIYGVVTTFMSIFLTMFFWSLLTTTVILALTPGFLASAIFWYDAYRLWSSLPRFKGDVR